MHYPQQEMIPNTDRFSQLQVQDVAVSEYDSLIRLALAVMSQRLQPGVALTSPDITQQYLQLRLGERQNEVFGVLFLDNQHCVLAFEELFYGTIDSATVHPRVVAQRALETNAAAVIFCHNHPSSKAKPSRADELLTQRLKEALALLDIRVLDHIIVGRSGVMSFAEHGIL